MQLLHFYYLVLSIHTFTHAGKETHTHTHTHTPILTYTRSKQDLQCSDWAQSLTGGRTQEEHKIKCLPYIISVSCWSDPPCVRLAPTMCGGQISSALPNLPSHIAPHVHSEVKGATFHSSIQQTGRRWKHQCELADISECSLIWRPDFGE